eukprot:3719960-Prorocentrum_lima.AAC.1
MQLREIESQRRQELYRHVWELGSSDSNYEPSSECGFPSQALMDVEQDEDGEEELTDTMTWR